jgi:hypothetical protein
VAPQPILPYASEPFGVYQPLIGWKSRLHRDRMAEAITSRVQEVRRSIVNLSKISDKHPIGTVLQAKAVDRTGTLIGRALAEHASNASNEVNVADFVSSREKGFSDMTHNVLRDLRKTMLRQDESGSQLRMASLHSVASEQLGDEAAMATTLHYLSGKAPLAVTELFRPTLNILDRTVASLTLFTDPQPARDAFLSPIGVLHLFREYFFQMGTFLGPPVGHVWISPGGTLELVESNTRRVLTEQTVEQSTERTTKTEVDTTDKDELSDAVKNENANDTKLGASATASGGVGGVFQASGSASFNLDESRKQAQEQTHKKMREQTSKLASEVRQNFKTTFRTVTETTDTSSRRYVLQNTTKKLVSYELSRKMSKVAVQIQDLGQRLCWQVYVDNPGDPLGIGDFVHATGAALDPSLKQSDQKPIPENQTKSFSSSIPFIHISGADSGATDVYTTSPNDINKGIFDPDVGELNVILFKHDIKCPPDPAGFQLSQVNNIDFHGAAVKFDPDLKLDATAGKFTILLNYASFNGQAQLPFEVTLVYEPTKKSIDDINAANDKAAAAYSDQLQAAKETQFYSTLRSRLKLTGGVRPRSQNDLREEERNVIYRSIISKLYGKQPAVGGWDATDYHVASELVRYFFDVDAMLYFVAPDWWKPRTMTLASKNATGEYQPTIIAKPAVSELFWRQGHGGQLHYTPGHRPYYLITEETAPAPMGASLGWLIQLDGDTHRNAFLNSPWVKAVMPIRPGREREAIAFLQRPEVADTEGLDEPYSYDPASDPESYKGQTIKGVLLQIADRIAADYAKELTPVKLDPLDVNSKMALPTETVFAHGYDPMEDGVAFGEKGVQFKVFSEWMEVLPTDQVVATEYNLKGL